MERAPLRQVSKKRQSQMQLTFCVSWQETFTLLFSILRSGNKRQFSLLHFYNSCPCSLHLMPLCGIIFSPVIKKTMYIILHIKDKPILFNNYSSRPSGLCQSILMRLKAEWTMTQLEAIRARGIIILF